MPLGSVTRVQAFSRPESTELRLFYCFCIRTHLSRSDSLLPWHQDLSKVEKQCMRRVFPNDSFLHPSRHVHDSLIKDCWYEPRTFSDSLGSNNCTTFPYFHITLSNYEQQSWTLRGHVVMGLRTWHNDYLRFFFREAFTELGMELGIESLQQVRGWKESEA